MTAELDPEPTHKSTEHSQQILRKTNPDSKDHDLDHARLQLQKMTHKLAIVQAHSRIMRLKLHVQTWYNPWTKVKKKNANTAKNKLQSSKKDANTANAKIANTKTSWKEEISEDARDATRKPNVLIKLPKHHPQNNNDERPRVVYSSAAQD